jgi:hypothetical protein
MKKIFEFASKIEFLFNSFINLLFKIFFFSSKKHNLISKILLIS